MIKVYPFLFCTLIFFSCKSQLNNADDLYNYALENSPSLKNASLDVKLSEEKIKQTISAGLPKINGSFGYQNYFNIPTTVVPAAAFSPGASDDELLKIGSKYFSHRVLMHETVKAIYMTFRKYRRQLDVTI